MNPLIDRQLAELKVFYPLADKQVIGDGSISIIVPQIVLPAGWSTPSTTVRFVAPVGFPSAKPDCFWTDQITLANGNVPKATAINQMPGSPEQYRWYSWHVATWSPNHDTLLTYLNVIRKRFDERQ